jgi:hypothetical protein
VTGNDHGRVEHPTGNGGAAGTEASELAQLRDERDRLRRHIDVMEDRRRRGGVIRRTAVTLLVLLSVVSFVAAGVGVFARRNFLDTDRWVQRVGPLSEEPAVEDRLGVYLTGQLTQLIDVRALFEDALPERGRILAVPLANAVEGFVGDRVDTFVHSDTFDRLWEGANRRAHAAAVRVLEGESRLETTDDGDVVLNLVPVIDAALAELSQASPEILGRSVSIPEVSVDDVPAAAISRIEDALDVDLAEDFGQVVVYRESQLTAAQDALDLFDRAVTALLVLTPVLVALALWLSRRRRRTLIQLLAGAAIGLVVLRRVVFALEAQVLDQVRVPANEPVVRATARAFIDPFIDATTWLLVGILAIALVAAVSAPYPWAVSLRRRVRDGARATAVAVGAAGSRARDERSLLWMQQHRQHLQLGGVAFALVVLWFADLPWWGVLVLLGIVAAYELGVSRLEAPPAPVDVRSEPAADGSSTAAPDRAGPVSTA